MRLSMGIPTQACLPPLYSKRQLLPVSCHRTFVFVGLLFLNATYFVLAVVVDLTELAVEGSDHLHYDE